ncbi:hypothetical protein AB0J81_41830 [Streptomyces bobili]|uniref:hypothetical protein n=1 Tax=Streptomyces bobili TaxID=67280 RepID=UPI00342BC489
MAPLRERKTYRAQVLRVPYEAVEATPPSVKCRFDPAASKSSGLTRDALTCLQV